MKETTPQSYYLAQQVLACEAGDGRDQAQLLGAAETALQKLRRHLGRWVGVEGFDAVFAHALHLSQVEFPFLPDGVGHKEPVEDFFLRWRDSLQKQDSFPACDAVICLFANLIWLLGVFMGEDIALRQLQRVWPEISLDRTGLRTEEAQQ